MKISIKGRCAWQCSPFSAEDFSALTREANCHLQGAKKNKFAQMAK